MEIPRDVNQPMGDADNLMNAYGTIPMARVRAFVAMYIQTKARAAQDSYQMYLCIMATLTKEANSRIVLQKDQYYVNEIPSRALLLRLVLQESSIDTKATTRFLREQLSSLNALMTEKDSNVIEFNESVRGLLDSLASRGETTQDLLSNLFKGYEAASDDQFVKYILKKQDNYDEGSDTTPDKLMLLAAQKYRTLVQAGKWNATDEKMQRSSRSRRRSRSSRRVQNHPKTRRPALKRTRRETKRKMQGPRLSSLIG
jgi:hypothetical protein